jgi:transglutaminase-like putative cysteine protease
MFQSRFVPSQGTTDFRGYLRRVANDLTRLATAGSESLAVRRFIQQGAWYLDSQLRAGRLLWAWRSLPTNYQPDTFGDSWQPAELTLQSLRGDCEDWAVLLAAILKALDIDARIVVVPKHAAVAVPITTAIPWPVAVHHPIPDNWPLVSHAGRTWLVLESTTTPTRRGLPGTDSDLIIPWLNTDQLWIGEA